MQVVKITWGVARKYVCFKIKYYNSSVQPVHRSTLACPSQVLRQVFDRRMVILTRIIKCKF